MHWQNMFLVTACLLTSVAARNFTVHNACQFTIWPAIFTDGASKGASAPVHPTGWEAKEGSSVSFNVPDNWKAGRIWGRRNCNFKDNPGPNSCPSGGCNGGLLCKSDTGTGVPPATVAEWTLEGADSKDWYDVSLVDGYNLPMRIDNNKGCHVADCSVDLGLKCPGPLQVRVNSSSSPVGCMSACGANPNDSASCCTGSHKTAETCPKTGVAYYTYFKGNCPNSYAYAYDESSKTALWTCDSSLKADYTLTFCPT